MKKFPTEKRSEWGVEKFQKMLGELRAIEAATEEESDGLKGIWNQKYELLVEFRNAVVDELADRNKNTLGAGDTNVTKIVTPLHILRGQARQETQKKLKKLIIPHFEDENKKKVKEEALKWARITLLEVFRTIYKSVQGEYKKSRTDDQEENYKLKPEEKTTIKAKLTEKMKEEMQAKAWAIIQELY